MLMTPAQALAISRSVVDTAAQDQMKEVEDKIKSHCSVGATSITFMFLHLQNKNTLINAGYKVQELKPEYFKISWD